MIINNIRVKSIKKKNKKGEDEFHKTECMTRLEISGPGACSSCGAWQNGNAFVEKWGQLKSRKKKGKNEVQRVKVKGVGEQKIKELKSKRR